jgi:hypothetical protein
MTKRHDSQLEYENEVLFRIPLGRDGINYEDLESNEVEPWGPASFRVAPDNTFLIADTATSRILRYDMTGRLIQRVEVTEAIGVTDVAASGDNLFVLDDSAEEPAIIAMSSTGFTSEHLKLPPDLHQRGLSGVVFDRAGEPLLELFGGAERLTVSGQGLSAAERNGGRFTVGRDSSSDRSRGNILFDNQPVASVEVEGLLGGMSVLHTPEQGDFYVLVEEVAKADEVFVDQTVRRYAPDGTMLGAARVPPDQLTYVRNGVAVAPDGNVYALVTHADGADVIRLRFKPDLEPLLPPKRTEDHAEEAGRADALLAGRTRAEMIATAKAYLNNEVQLSERNINGPCAGRGKPRYLGRPGPYKSVSYDWGGWDTLEQFNRSMARNLQAGDIRVANVESCSHGVDCSGFVTRCWGITDRKHGTGTLPGISNRISTEQLLPGDILNKAGRHVVLFDHVGNNGVVVYEATTTNKLDRVIHKGWPWSRFRRGGYIPRRYRGVA